MHLDSLPVSLFGPLVTQIGEQIISFEKVMEFQWDIKHCTCYADQSTNCTNFNVTKQIPLGNHNNDSLYC